MSEVEVNAIKQWRILKAGYTRISMQESGLNVRSRGNLPVVF
jgi:hypothetical protein